MVLFGGDSFRFIDDIYLSACLPRDTVLQIQETFLHQVGFEVDAFFHMEKAHSLDQTKSIHLH